MRLSPKYAFYSLVFALSFITCENGVSTKSNSRDFLHLVNDIPTWTEDSLVNVVIEIPAGTNLKYEVNKESGRLDIEQIHSQPRTVNYLPYPVNYGMIPGTLLAKEDGGDGDPLDVMVFGSAMDTASIASVRVIGLLRLLDGGEQDDKLLAILPKAHLSSIEDLDDFREMYPGALNIIEIWFINYKGPDQMKSQGWSRADEAGELLLKANASY